MRVFQLLSVSLVYTFNAKSSLTIERVLHNNWQQPLLCWETSNHSILIVTSGHNMSSPCDIEEMFKAKDLNGEDKKDKRRSTFLPVVGNNILRSLLAPTKLSDKTLEQLTETLTKHFSPPPSEVIQRCRFHSRTRRDGKSVFAFMAELRKLSEHCNFCDELQKSLQDRIVARINDETIQQKLLSEAELTNELN